MGNRQPKYKLEDIEYDKPPDPTDEMDVPTEAWTLPTPKRDNPRAEFKENDDAEATSPNNKDRPTSGGNTEQTASSVRGDYATNRDSLNVEYMASTRIYGDFLKTYVAPPKPTVVEKDEYLRNKRIQEEAKAKRRAFEVYWRKKWFYPPPANISMDATSNDPPGSGKDQSKDDKQATDQAFKKHLEEQVAIGLGLDVSGYVDKHDKIRARAQTADLSQAALKPLLELELQKKQERLRKKEGEGSDETDIPKITLDCLIIWKDVSEDLLSISRREIHRTRGDPKLLDALKTWENLLRASLQARILPAIAEVDNFVDLKKAERVREEREKQSKAADGKKRAAEEKERKEKEAKEKAQREAEEAKRVQDAKDACSRQIKEREAYFDKKRRADRSAVGLPW